MVKNVKIDEETHRLLGMKAAELSIQKGNLCSILIRKALEVVDNETIELLHVNYNPEKTED